MTAKAEFFINILKLLNRQIQK